MFEVDVSSISPERFGSVLPVERFEAFMRAIERGRKLLTGKVVWDVNSTARGGGGAELLQSRAAAAGGAGVDTRWLVIHGSLEFFVVTKRIHNRLHGAQGDGGKLDDEARAIYEQALADNVAPLV